MSGASAKKAGRKPRREPTAAPCESSADATELAARAAAGDRAAFRCLVESCQRPLSLWARRVMGRPEEAEDLVQEVFARAWMGLAGGRAPEAALPWLFGIARRARADRARARRWSLFGGRRGAEEDVVDRLLAREGGEVSGPRELVESAERAATVRRAVASLPPRHRTVLLLREVDELSYEELAAALGCPIGTVESRLYRARAALAARLERLARRGELD